MVNSTNISTLKSTFAVQGENMLNLGQTSAKERIRKLRKLESSILNHQGLICEALYKDLGKSEAESKVSEVFILLSELRHVRRNLRTWMCDKQIPSPIFMLGSKAYIRYESKGRALIIAPWNYPFLLSLSPLIGAIAAGCPAIIKPSEYSGHTSALIAKIIKEVFDSREVDVILG